MFTPNRSQFPIQDLSIATRSTNTVLTLIASDRSVIVTHDGFRIGASRQCDLTLNDPGIPAFHSVVHVQHGALWIETVADDLYLIVNDRPCRRIALRHDDRISIGAVEFKIQIRDESIPVPISNLARLDEDLSLLTAEELCDRILAEQSSVSEFIEGRRSGWEALLEAIQTADDEPLARDLTGEATRVDAALDHITIESLLEQINELDESVKRQTREISVHEQEVLDSASMMEESQDRALQQLDQIIEKLKNSDPPNELRASA